MTFYPGVPVYNSKIHRCGCDERLNCTAKFDANLPVPAGWKIARCPCGNPMNWQGDVSVDAPALLCPDHDVPGLMKHWVCEICDRNASAVVVSEVSKVEADDPARPA